MLTNAPRSCICQKIVVTLRAETRTRVKTPSILSNMKIKTIFGLLCVVMVCIGCEPDPITSNEKNQLIGTWNSSFEYEDPYWPGEYRVAEEYVQFISNNRMIYESMDDMSEFPDVGLYVFRLSHKEFSYEMTENTLILSYLPDSSYRDNITPGDKDLPPLVTSTFEYTTQYTITSDTTLVLSDFTHDGKNFKKLSLTKINK